MVPKSENRFIRLNLITIVVTLLLILAGGIVRSTGSGMGCPDWPKCFDRYVPPTSVSQLPPDYKEKYVAERVAKNERFANYLDRLGKGHLADSIRSDVSILQPESFNVSKTWTEYVNRLMGAVTGFLLIGLAVFSFAFRKIAKRIVVLSIVNLFVVMYQGWLGSIVVSTNLMAWVVTVHMLLALIILGILIYTYHYTRHLHQPAEVVASKELWLKIILIVSILVTVVQVILGTEVREAIDAISKSLNNGNRDIWVSKIGEIFIYHRDMALLVLVSNIIIYKLIKDKFALKTPEIRIGNAIAIVLIVQLGSGLLLSSFALPPYAQAIHVLFSTMLFSLQYYLYLLINRKFPYKA